MNEKEWGEYIGRSLDYIVKLFHGDDNKWKAGKFLLPASMVERMGAASQVR